MDLFAMARTGDMETARGAAVIAIGHASEGRRKVLAALLTAGQDGLTDHESAAATGLIQTSSGKRRLELERDGLVRRAIWLVPDADDDKLLHVPATRLSPSGVPCAVWCISPAGVEQAREWGLG
jgi:hypothetical protein